MRKAQRPHVTALATTALLDHGWTEAGLTRSEVVRIPTSQSPVFGGIGGELRAFGGRARFAKGERRCTVGPRLTCFYRLSAEGPTDFLRIPTTDLEAIQREAAREHGSQEPPATEDP